MSLDARVYCDCLEKGRLKDELAALAIIHVKPDGYPLIILDGEEIWDDNPRSVHFVCDHERRALVHHWLGNIWLVARLRSELSREKDLFPILLSKVVYNGIHGGDDLPLDLIPELQNELEKLRSFRCTGNMPKIVIPRLLWKLINLSSHYPYINATMADEMMQEFRAKMVELSEAALRVRKPIAF